MSAEPPTCPNLRLMLARGRYYSYEGSRNELQAVLDTVDRLAVPPYALDLLEDFDGAPYPEEVQAAFRLRMEGVLADLGLSP